MIVAILSYFLFCIAAAEAKNSWNNARGTFRKNECLRLQHEKSGAAGPFKCTWVHWDAIAFVRGHVRLTDK